MLHETDCVIVPGFGGLVSHYQPARIHPTQHIFSPPSKAIAFNVNLSQNDGLLAQQISRNTGCDYREAMNLISRQVQEMQFALDQGKSIRLDEIGMFKLDVEKNLQFFPAEETNYLADSFGLSEFQSQAIIRDGIREKQKPGTMPVFEKPAESGKKKKVFRRALALGSIALFSGICSLPFLFPDSKLGMNQLSGYFSTEAAQPAKFRVRENNPALLPSPSETKLDAHEISSFDFLQDGSPALVIDKRNYQAAQADTTRAITIPDVVVRESKIRQFEIIAGCFSVEDNALKYVAQLKADFPQAAIIGKNNSGLYRVSIGSAAGKEQAEELLSESRHKLPQAWLLSNN